MRHLGIGAAVVVLALPVTVAVQSDAGGRAVAGREWPAVGGDAGNARYSTLTQITPGNVGRLGGAWTSPKFEPAGSARAMTVVKDGMIFVSLPPSVYAFNAKTGATAWRFQAGGGRGQAAAQTGLGSPAESDVLMVLPPHCWLNSRR